MFKLLHSALLLAPFLITSTQACIRVHTYLDTDPVTGDVMAIQAWDNKDKICDGGGRKYLASDETVWAAECNDGWELKTSANGRTGEIWNHGTGFHANLVAVDHDQQKYCRYKTGENERCAGWVFDYEYVLWDNGDKCDDKLNTKPCQQQLCDLPADDVLSCTIGGIGGIGGIGPDCNF